MSMASDRHAPGEACCGVCRDFVGREPPPRPDTPPLRLSPEEAVVQILEPRQEAWREVRPSKAEVVFGRSAQAERSTVPCSSERPVTAASGYSITWP